MARMPSFEEIRADWERDVSRIEQRIEHPFRHNDEPRMTPHVDAAHAATQTPATAPDSPAAPAASTQGDTMPLTQIEDDVKADLTAGVSWVKEWAARIEAAAPGIIATTDAVGGSTVGKLVEIAAGKILPPGVEEEFLALAGRYFGAFGQVPAAPVTAPQPVPAQ